MKVDAQIVEERWRTISYMKRYSYPKLYCKKLSNQKPIWQIQLALQEEQLWLPRLPFHQGNFQQFQVPFFLTKISLRNYHFGSSVFIVTADLFVWLFLSLAISHQAYPQTCQWSVHSCKIDQSATQFLGWWGGVYYERVHRSSFLVLS